MASKTPSPEMHEEKGRTSGLRVAFMGTPDFAVESLRALHATPGVSIPLVVTQPDRPRGRGQELQPTPVKAAALALGLPVAQPESMRDDTAAELLREQAPDIAVVAAYGQILDERILNTPRLGCINVHASLLPRWRGAAPIQRAIEAGDAVTGVSIMQMERGLDTGPVYAMAATMIGDAETAGELHDRLASLGGELLSRTLHRVADPAFAPTPQPSARACYARKIDGSDRNVRFDESPLSVASRINAMSPWPGVRVEFNGEELTLLRARPLPDYENTSGREPGTIVALDPRAGIVVQCQRGAVTLLEVKRPGKRAVSAADYLNGARVDVGMRFGAP